MKFVLFEFNLLIKFNFKELDAMVKLLFKLMPHIFPFNFQCFLHLLFIFSLQIIFIVLIHV